MTSSPSRETASVMNTERPPHIRRYLAPSSVATTGWMMMLLCCCGAAAFSPSENAGIRNSGGWNSRVRTPNSGRTYPFESIPTSGIPSAVSATDTTSVRRRSTVRLLTVRPRGVFSTRLGFRDSDDDDAHGRRQQHDQAAASLSKDNKPASSRWWGSMFHRAPAQPKDASQFMLDDYLECVDRRYRRLHSEDGSEGTLGINTAWNWLMEQRPMHYVDAAKQQEDALYVLGLSKLASDRLLQKHHLPPRQAEEKPTVKSDVILDAASVTLSVEAPPLEVEHQTSTVQAGKSSTPPVIAVVKCLEAGSSVLKRIQARREAFLALQSKQVLSALVTSVKFLPVAAAKAISTLINLSGGKRTLAAAGTIAASVLIFLRPLGETILKESAFNS